MPRLVLLLLLATGALAQPVVRDGGATLFDSCGAGAATVAELSAGQPVRIAFAITGDRGNCYKVRLERDGRSLQGYLEAKAVVGTESFRTERRTASRVELPQALRAEITRMQDATPAPAAGRLRDTGAVPRALALIDRGEPREALRILESALKQRGDDPVLLATAGMAAYQCDNPRRALYFWKSSQQIQSNVVVSQLIRRAEKEIDADSTDNVLHGARFTLRYESSTADAVQAGQMLAVLEEESNRVSGEIGCVPREQTTVIVQSPEAYRAGSSVAAWSGGHYDGRIHIPLATGTITPEIRKTFAHEIVHACLVSLGTWPIWFQEGMAQYHSGERLSAGQQRQVKTLAAQAGIRSLAELAGSFGGLSTDRVGTAYGVSLLAVETLYVEFGAGYVRNLLRNPSAMTTVEGDLSQRIFTGGDTR